ncbi:MAG: ABC transporter substrate-binding protein [Acidobacteria bacterium]|nr:ABC transporter substrate-binding protein [Acidobacteriaceae bacterium]MBV9609468.1 ABC transporter substrate-binding protein [Acidobacteriota bacterium]
MKRLIALGAVVVVLLVAAAFGQTAGGELRFFLRSEPKTFNPVMVADDSSETIRYLTGGVLIRVNRQTQQAEPELASSWKLSKDSSSISFMLRERVYFSDGTPFSADDVAYTMKQLMDPALHSTTGDAFRSSSGEVRTQVTAPNRVTITFPAPVAGLEKLFDQVAMMSAKSPKKERAALGPFYVADYKPGAYVLLNRNPNYWKKDASGRQLPYLASIRLDIQANRDIEALRFRRGEIDLINSLETEYFDKLSQTSPSLVHDAGPSLDTEQMWFNQAANAPIPAYKKAWFTSTNFRRAVSAGLNRADMCRVVFASHATPAAGPVSPANKFWFNGKLKPMAYDAGAALRELQADGFRLQNGILRDRYGHEVEFSIITNSGNKSRERLATMIQEDLAKVGMKVNVVTLDFPSLIERITQNFNYEAALLGLVNTELDPNSVMTVWLSSAENHQWNPSQKTPETQWEAEIDKLMRQQASSTDPNKRKAAFDRVQEIVVEQQPFIYLVNKNALSAVSAGVQGAVPVVLRPQTYWNAERLSLSPQIASAR